MKLTKEHEFEIGKKIAEVMGWSFDSNRTCRDKNGFLIATNGLVYYVCQNQRQIAMMLREKMMRSGFAVHIDGVEVDRKIKFTVYAMVVDRRGFSTKLVRTNQSDTGDIEVDECTMLTDLFLKVFNIKVSP